MNLSAQELREIFLNNTLDADLMSMNDYEKLFDYETELSESNSDILVFCSSALNQFDDYCIDVPKSPFEAIIKKYERNNRRIRKNTAFKATQRVAAIFVITAVTALLAQGISMAFGFDLFKFIRNWLFDEAVEITTIEIDDDDVFDLTLLQSSNDNENSSENINAEDEIIFLDFEQIDDIYEVWLNRISPFLINHYEFDVAYYFKVLSDEKFEIHFIDKNDNLLVLLIQNMPMRYYEKEDDGYIKEITANGITFTIFNNMEDFQVIWEYEGLLYNLGAFLPLETIEEIINNYYE
jgi:hypothetical protein